jgi:hypothetical protein
LEHLVVIDVVAAGHIAILQTVWATTDDRQSGHRRTDSETIESPSKLLARLGELAPLIFPDAEQQAAA